jgi:hypothetical protein
MNWHNTKHKLRYSPNMGRVLLPKKLPYSLYHKLYGQLLYSQHETNNDPVYATWLKHVLKSFKETILISNLIQKLKQQISFPQTYSLKKDPKGYRLELYFYYSKVDNFSVDLVYNEFSIFIKILEEFGVNTSSFKNSIKQLVINDCVIWSYDIYDYDELFGKHINFYTIYEEDCNSLVYKGTQFTRNNDDILKEGYFICFPYRYKPNFNLDLKYQLTDKEIDIAYNILKKYDCLEYNISNKKEISGETIFFVQYFGISDSDYIKFLRDNLYPSNLVEEITTNQLFYKTMSKEITEVYKLNDFNKPFRTALYGLI